MRESGEIASKEYPKDYVNLQTDRLTSLEVYFMARKKESPQKAALRDMMSITLEDALDQELDEELG